MQWDQMPTNESNETLDCSEKAEQRKDEVCPECRSELVHDENHVFNRCLQCGWFNKREKEEVK